MLSRTRDSSRVLVTPMPRTGFSLCPEVSFCDAGGRLLFLDLSKDRYFCLTPDGESAFRRLLGGTALDLSDQDALSAMVMDGLLITSALSSFPRPSPPQPRPSESLVEEHRPTRNGTLALAAVRLTHGRTLCRLASLSSIVRTLAGRKRRLRIEHPQSARIAGEVAAAFTQLSRFIAPLDQCLPRSVAIAHALIDRQVRPDLVIGVKINPFGAHCWVQHGDAVANDLVDHVSGFTPILVV